jgi:hypothetical protein
MTATMRWLIAILLPALGFFFAWRLLKIPTRLETAAFFIVFFVIPTLRWPKFAVYYIFTLTLFIPLFRRVYYLIESRPKVDYLMLIGDGVMVGFIGALILLWIKNKERLREPLTVFVLIYASLLFIKVFFLNEGDIESGLYGFKFNGLYVLFFFAGSYVVVHAKGMLSVLSWSSIALFFTALWSLKQITLGFSGFEQKWLDSITFTTLRIEGVVRPFGTYVSPAAMSDGMCILILLGAFYVAYRRALSPLWGLGLISVAIIPLLIATVRTSWIGALAALLFFGFYLRVEKKWIRNLILVATFASMTGLLFKEGSDTSQTSRNLSGQSLADVMIRKRTAALANPLQEYSVQKRMQIWGEIWYYAMRKPLGRGQGTSGYAHSYYFQILGEIGFPGIAAFFAILYLAFSRGFQALALRPTRGEAELLRLFMSIIFLISILNLTGTHLHTNPGDIYFWFSVGAIAQLYRTLRERANGEPSDVHPNHSPGIQPAAA